MQDDFRVSISTELRYRLGEQILVTFELTNVSDRHYRLLVWNTPLEQEVLDYFLINCNGHEVHYDGRLVKRGQPDESAYRLVRAGETVVEQLDISTAFPITELGTYTLTLDAWILDAIPQVEGAPAARTIHEHRGFALPSVSATFDLVGDGAPRPTVAATIRQEISLQAPSPATTDPKAKNLSAKVPVGGTAANQIDVNRAHANARAYVQAAERQLNWVAGASNALYSTWFGAFDAGRYATVRQHFSDIGNAIENDSITYDLTGSGCDAGDYAYTYKGTNKVWLCSDFWSAPATGTDSQFGTLVHEISHAISGTDDVKYNGKKVYGQADSLTLASNVPGKAILNADNHEFFVEALAERVLTAPVCWNNGKAYFFVAGLYYRFNITKDKVDSGYPSPISINWPGLFADRLDAGIMWPNGKAYFFRDDQYIRYDIKKDKADAGYPKPISPNWSGLWADGIDAAVKWPNGKAYFFKGSEYIRFDIEKDKADAGYPKSIATHWPGLWSADLNGGVVWSKKKAYFFRGGEYVRYDIAKDKVDSGYPKPITPNWSGLPAGQ